MTVTLALPYPTPPKPGTLRDEKRDKSVGVRAFTIDADHPWRGAAACEGGVFLSAAFRQ